jgi:alpha-aminoadipic semialdehyde synthase
MEKKMLIGVRSEDKNEWEQRVPLVPEDIRKLQTQGLNIIVQASQQRAFADQEYSEQGIPVQKELKNCDIIFGLKEIPLPALAPDKIYVIFSHVIKGQAYNMPMLKKMMELGTTLIDYEAIVDDRKRRLIFFGRYAGLAGMINSLWALGRRLEVENIPSPFCKIQQAKTYPGLNQARSAIQEVAEAIQQKGLPPAIHPLFVGFAGYGNVSLGAQEIFDILPFREIAPRDVARSADDPSLSDSVLYKVVFKEEHCVEARDPQQPFDLQDYYEYGKQKYKGVFYQYLKHLTLLINCNYWDSRYPRILSLEACKNMWRGAGQPRLRVIGDISCDIDGSIQCTVKPTYPDNPVYVYHPDTGKTTDGFQGHGPVIMAVEILPAELPRESSIYFSSILKDFLPDFTGANYTLSFEKLNLPPEIKRAMILYRGELTPDYKYIEKYLEA